MHSFVSILGRMRQGFIFIIGTVSMVGDGQRCVMHYIQQMSRRLGNR